MGLWGYAFWGVLGAFVYGAPRLLIALSEPLNGVPRWRSWGDFVMSMIIGTIGSAGFTQLVATTLHQTSEPEVRALSVVIGMIANPVAPVIVHLVGENVLRHLNAPLKTPNRGR